MVRIGIECRHGYVRYHHGVDAGRDCLAKRWQFDGLQMRTVHVHAGNAEM